MMKSALCVLAAGALLLSLTACAKKPDATQPTAPTGDTSAPATEATTEPATTPTAPEDGVFGVDYDSLYARLGDRVRADMVYESGGDAYVLVDGQEYALGLDFLSMAMTLNTSPIADNPAFDTAQEVYTAWWRLFAQRWNRLVPRLPLYAQQTGDVYAAVLTDYAPGEGKSSAQALTTAAMSGRTESLRWGFSAAPAGSYRFAAFGKEQADAGDLAIQTLTTGLSTVYRDASGSYAFNPTVVARHDEMEHEDGSKTFVITLRDDLTFSDGSAVTAKNYLVHTLVFASAVGVRAAGLDSGEGSRFVGYRAYRDAQSESVPFSGLRLLGERTFSVTVDGAYLPDYFDARYVNFTPEYLPMWLGEGCDIADDGDGARITGDWYDAEGVNYTMAEHIAQARKDTQQYPYSGPYCVQQVDPETGDVTLAVNPRYPGDETGAKPGIAGIVCHVLTDTTPQEALRAGTVDLVTGLTGDTLEQARAVAEQDPQNYGAAVYGSGSCASLYFRGEYGPAAFPEVRRAVAYTLDRGIFAQEGAATPVLPLSGDNRLYQSSRELLSLETYAYSAQAAAAELEAGGWIYGADGAPYSGSGLRYRKLSAAELTEENRQYASLDGQYRTVEVGGEYYMPLVLNACLPSGRTGELLQTNWAGADALRQLGMAVQVSGGMDQAQALAAYDADPLENAAAQYTVFCFAAQDPDPADFSWNYTVDPELFATYSACRVKDEADICRIS